MNLAAGVRLGPYEIVSPLGAGGMGDVYRARDTRLGRDVAIKVLSPHLAADPAARARFEREARAASSLNHPHICALYDVGRERAADGGEIDFLVMELIEGETLSARLTRGPLAIAELLRIGAQMADALDKAHRMGLVHRDLKPANVMLTKSGGSVQAKLLDFGLAKSTARAPQPDLTVTKAVTQEGTIAGTFYYMAPEQLEGREADTRCDIWAFGVTLYEMATARRAFDAPATATLIGAILRDDPPPIAQLRPMTPAALDRIVRECLQKDPDERWQSAADLKRELEWIAASSSAAIAAPATGVAVSRRRRLAYAAAACLIAAGIGGAGWWAGRTASAGGSVRWEQFTQLTDLSGEEQWPSVSADGTSVAYASEARGSWDVYVQRIGGRNRILIAGDPDKAETAPAFSPDGASIAFHESDGDGGIFIAGATGESARRLTDFGFHPAWSPDGRSIAFCTEEVFVPYSRATTSQLWVVPIAGGSPLKIYEGDAVQPAWSPSGRRIAFWSAVGGQRDLQTVPATGGEAIPITRDEPLDWSPAWSSDGHLYFASDRGGPMNIWRIGVDETTGRTTTGAEAVTAGVQAGLATPTLTADGLRLVFSSQVRSVNPVGIPFDPVREQLGSPRPVLRRTGILTPTGVSPDGLWLALSNLGERQEDIFICRADGSDLRRLTDDMHRDRVPVWSPDGNRLAFFSNRGGEFDVWTIGRDGGGLQQVTKGARATFPVFSPDGTHLLLASSARGAAWPPGLFVIPANGGWNGTDGALPGTRDGDVAMVTGTWSPDGRLLVGIVRTSSGRHGGLGIYDLAAKRMRRLPIVLDWSVRWLPDGRRVVGVQTNGAIVVVDTVSGASKTLTPPVKLAGTNANFTASRDGRTFYGAATQIESDIWLVQASR